MSGFFELFKVHWKSKSLGSILFLFVCLFAVKKQIWVQIWVQIKILNFEVQETNNNLYATLDFFICWQKANDCYGITLKILYFILKNEWYSSKFRNALWKTNGRLSETVESCILQYLENFAFLILRILELFAREVC